MTTKHIVAPQKYIENNVYMYLQFLLKVQLPWKC